MNRITCVGFASTKRISGYLTGEKNIRRSRTSPNSLYLQFDSTPSHNPMIGGTSIFIYIPLLNSSETKRSSSEALDNA